jgi:hypothetical protein
MNDRELFDELLELTLACQQPEATIEQRARLERLLADNPHAISWYLEIVDDTLTLRDASTATFTASTSQAPGLLLDKVANLDKPGAGTRWFTAHRSRLWLSVLRIGDGPNFFDGSRVRARCGSVRR